MPAETAGNRSHHLVYKRESFTHRAHKSDLWLFPMRLGVHKRPFTSARPQVPVHKCSSPVHKCRPQMQGDRNGRSESHFQILQRGWISILHLRSRHEMSRDGGSPRIALALLPTAQRACCAPAAQPCCMHLLPNARRAPGQLPWAPFAARTHAPLLPAGMQSKPMHLEGMLLRAPSATP